MLIVGLMSGTSADGIDAALVEIIEHGSKLQVNLKRSLFVAHSDEMRQAIAKWETHLTSLLQESYHHA